MQDDNHSQDASFYTWSINKCQTNYKLLTIELVGINVAVNHYDCHYNTFDSWHIFAWNGYAFSFLEYYEWLFNKCLENVCSPSLKGR